MDDSKLQNVLTNLLIWLKGQNQFEYKNISEPNIEITDRKKMCLLAYRDSYIHINKKEKCSVIFGLYNYKNKTIYINHDLDLTSKKGQAIVLHELVHHFQYESGDADKVVNINQLEPLAYFLEKKFNKEYSLLALNKHFH
jgi:Zn-dependent peptidase ImmA (M78 family)